MNRATMPSTDDRPRPGIREWRSLVARSPWEREVAGSNPASRTIRQQRTTTTRLG